MSLSREQILREMGLTQWKLRARPTAQEAVWESVEEGVEEGVEGRVEGSVTKKAQGGGQAGLRDAHRGEGRGESPVVTRAVASAPAGTPENNFLPDPVREHEPEHMPEYRAPGSADEPAAPAGRGAGVPEGERGARIAGMNWDELRRSIADCRACGLCAERRQTVPGVGDEQADWLFIGEAPGSDEDACGEPFVGPAGKLLDAMLAAIDLKRGADVYLANVVKCHSPANHTPDAAEMMACAPYLQRQIELLQPKLIVLLGRAAVQAVLGVDSSLASLRGKPLAYAAGGREIPVVVTYHPAYLLRTLPDKAKTWEDLCRARALMRELKAGAVLTP